MAPRKGKPAVTDAVAAEEVVTLEKEIIEDTPVEEAVTEEIETPKNVDSRMGAGLGPRTYMSARGNRITTH